ncbi:MAG: hypothetical protein ACRC9P_08905, partial [Bacteroides sp.]
GRCRFAVSSTVSSMVIFGSSVDLNTLYVHEYMWAGEDKVLKSWHRWEFEAPIAHAFFTGELINIITVETSSGTIFVNTLDPKSNAGTIKDSDSYFLDYSIELPVKDTEGKPTVTLPEMYSNFMLGHDLGSKLTVAYRGGDLNGSEIGADVCSKCKTITLNPSTTATSVVIGVPYKSILIPSPPIFKDFLDRAMVFNRIQLIKMYIQTGHTGMVEVIVKDRPRGYDSSYDVNPVRWLSKDLNLGRLPVGGIEGSVIPCRVDANTAQIEFHSYGLTEMNILNLEYTCKAGKMRQRR